MGSAQEESNHAKQQAKLLFAHNMLVHIRQARREIRTSGGKDSDAAVARWLNDYNQANPEAPIVTARGKTRWTGQQVNDLCNPEPTARAVVKGLQVRTERTALGYEAMSRLIGIVPDQAGMTRFRQRNQAKHKHFLEHSAALGRLLRLEERPGDLPGDLP
jgi:hypothetical protein